MWNRLDHQLGYPISHLYVNRGTGIQIRRKDRDFPAVTRIDQSRGIDDRKPLAQGSATSRMNEPRVARRETDCDTGWDRRALSWTKSAIQRGVQIQSRITRMRVFGQDCVGVQPLKQHCDIRD
jgi:hypothetical protein